MGPTPQRVIKFPIERIPRAAAEGASRWLIWKERLRELTGRALSRLGLPGAIAEVKINDSLTGQQISVDVGPLYVRLTVNQRDYYFNRVTGRFDGTGSAP
jgi:hypothetical protein